MSARKRKAAPQRASIDGIIAALGGRWPVVEGPGWALVNGDCLEVMAAMPPACVEVVITDPPYEAEAHTEQRRQKVYVGLGEYGVDETPLDFGAITTDQRASAARHFARVALHRAVAFCQAEAVAAWRDAFNVGGIPYRRALPWVKPDAMPSLHGRWPGQGYESIVVAQHPSSPPCPVGGKSRVYSFVRAQAPDGHSKNPHPTTKPPQLMAQMVEDFTDPGDLVLDACAGSGTTGVACLRLGRQFIGIERDPSYFEIACRRMRGDEAKPRPEQPSIFDLIPAATARAKETP